MTDSYIVLFYFSPKALRGYDNNWNCLFCDYFSKNTNIDLFSEFYFIKLVIYLSPLL